MSNIILDLCGGTGAWSKPYREAGYDVRILTLPDHDITKFEVVNKNCFYFPSYTDHEKREYIFIDEIAGILAAPPCTMFSIARNDKTAKTPRDLRQGMKVVQACLEIVHECLHYHYRKDGNGLRFWALENPTTGYLQRFLGKAPLEFNPYDYGDPYTKRTSLWGEFNEPNKNPVKPNKKNFVKFTADQDETRKEKESLIPEGYQQKTGYDKRKIMRSITPQGFAQAFYEANK